MKLAPRQQELWDLREQGKTREEIASIMGISVNNVSKTISIIRKKLGLKGRIGNVGVEEKDPEKAAAILDAVSDPAFKWQEIQAAYDAAGIPKVGEAMVERLRVKYSGAISETRNLQRKELSDMLGKKIHLAMQYMDDKVMSEASFRDLAMGSAQLIEKKQLIDGQPTQIVSAHERAKLNELAPALLKEIQRRGLTFDGQVTEKVVEPA